MKKISLVLSCIASLGVLSVSASALDEGLIEARVESFKGIGAAVRFQHMETLFHTEEVKKGEHTWPLIHNKDLGLSQLRYRYQGKEYGIREFMASNRGNALLVLKDGEIIEEMYLNGSDYNSRFMSMSVGKSITSTLVGMAVEDGHIKSLDDQMTKYVPKLKGSAYDGATIRDVMQMASGANLNEDYSMDPEGAKVYVDCLYNTWFAATMRMSDCPASLKRKHAPGTNFNYNSFDTQALGKLVENATGMRFHQYLEKRLWKPMGMEADMEILVDSTGEDREAVAAGGFLMTLRDYGRFGQMMLNKGKANGRQVVSEAWVQEATKADPNKPFLQVGAIDDYGIKVGYQHQWWLYPNDEYAAEGVFGQFIYIMPADNLVIVKLSYWEDHWPNEQVEEVLSFFSTVKDYLKDK